MRPSPDRLTGLIAIACLAATLVVAPAADDVDPAEDKPAAAEEVPSIASTETDRLLTLEGKTVRVTGRIASTGRSRSGNQFLNFAESEFMTVTFATDLKKFSEGEPADVFEGKAVAITGPLKIYKGIPEIVLNDPALIRVIDIAELVVPAPKPEPEPEPVVEPEPEPEPEVVEVVEKKPEPAGKKPPVDWRVYFPE